MNTTCTRMALVLGLGIWAAVAVGCVSETEVPQLATVCEGGEVVELEAGTVCVYSQAITETRFRCPPEMPYRVMFDNGFWVCSATDRPASDFEDELVDRGYLDPPMSDEPPLREPPLEEPPIEEPPVEEPPVEEPPVEEPPVEEPECAEGEQLHCQCSGGEPGIQTCTDEATWDTCVCPDTVWTAPGVNEVQEPPLGCADASLITDYPASVDNAEQAPGACLEEVFERGCPIMRTRRAYVGEAQEEEALEIINRDVFEQTMHHWYYNTQPYVKTWSINDFGEPDWFEEDSGADGDIDSRVDYTYNERGLLVREESIFFTSEALTVNVWTYDEEGRPTLREYTSDYGDGEVSSGTVEWRYNETGQMVESRWTQNGELAARSRWMYDDQGVLTRTEDNNGFIFTEINYTYREDGTLEQEWKRELDVDEDGTRWVRGVYETFYDAQEREVRYVYNDVTETLWVYNDDGLLVEQTYGYLGTRPEWIRTWAYNDDGIPTRAEYLEVRRPGGRDWLTVTLYNAEGLPVSTQKIETGTERLMEAWEMDWAAPGYQTLRAHDRDGDGVWDSRSTWLYDDANQLLDAQIDHNADGFIEERTIYRYGNDCTPR